MQDIDVPTKDDMRMSSYERMQMDLSVTAAALNLISAGIDGLAAPLCAIPEVETMASPKGVGASVGIGAQKAETSLTFEQGHGLLAADYLWLDLKRLESAYTEGREHDYEITTSISLCQIDPLALLRLRFTGSTTFSFEEYLFELDFPGHYMRRLRSLAVSIPAVIGPHGSINATLTLRNHKYRVLTTSQGGTDYLTASTDHSTFRYYRYVDLHKELNILPDVSIAEEARDHLPVSKDIYELVMNALILYRVMNDCNLSLFDTLQGGACLNGDNCVRSTLDKRQSLHCEIFPPPFYITEDCINGEMQCIVRGIYHNTVFARWCYEQPHLAVLRKFVHARFIMNDDLTWVTYNQPVSKEDLPHIIRYPQQAGPTTYMELFRLMSELKQLVAQALIVCNEPNDFLRVEPELTPEIYEEITNEVRSLLFREFVDQRISYEEEEKLADWTELLHDCYDVEPYDHLVSKEMKPHFTRALEELTLDDVGFESRRAYPPDVKDARDLMRYISTFPNEPRDHYREGHERSV
ncbi:hypothetical protein FACUT_13131 [Fusarium acutatum]|uniref:Tc toxin complex TcA C-terminal TcB-binding domain-containing protein n=1 Tax=Fusarium acutatum TaxID=78861 RepID=A0A8H4J9R9_9HYPO|nr:hypothetical protein FACUT_13131 [Fusarium acutatum]